MKDLARLYGKLISYRSHPWIPRRSTITWD